VLSGGERGLLGLAFHPQFSSNRRFFVNYTNRPNGATVIAEYKVSASDPNVADTAETILLTIAQPFANHNGGMIDFGRDGFLYIGLGDGGSANDPGNRAQNIEELLGKMLRIDVDTPSGNLPYSSPPTNPFFGNTPGRDEIYAVGLRNPWRWSFDRQTGELWAGDVGQGQIEEIDIIRLGENYGWRVLEGRRCTNLGPGSCADPRFIPPIYEYPHVGSNCSGSVTGGYVYRGAAGSLPVGSYVFADYCFGTIYLWENNQARTLLDTSLGITSFGEDESGEIYVLEGGGSIYKLVNGPARALANVSAASFRGEALAQESIVAAFGTGLASATQSATTTPLPTVLQETRVFVRDAAGTTRNAGLFFVSANQVNFQIPPGTATGAATISITNNLGAVFAQTINIAATAPALFAANATGRGLAAAVALRVRADNTQSFEPVVRFEQNQPVAVPIDLGPESDRVFLVPFGTGFRFRRDLSAVAATIGGQHAPVTFAAAQGQLIGVDQANILIPRSLAARGEVDVVLTVEGQTANVVRVNIR
jgi:uncharacterized protein (TIGR03437 family)